MAFEDEIIRHVEQIKTRLPFIKGEEATKQALVVPFLQVLGYDVWDPREVQPEYIADFAKKKSNGQMEKIDYALHGRLSRLEELLHDHSKERPQMVCTTWR